jgi:solute carrier family 25 (mitochondrial phosphate transporter), member 23/24/25/41
MTVFEILQSCMKDSDGDISGASLLTSGAISGSVGAAAIYPLSLLRVRLQASGHRNQPYIRSTMHAARIILRESGWRGFYVGLSATLLKVG